MRWCEKIWGFDLFYHAKSLWWLCFSTWCWVLTSEAFACARVSVWGTVCACAFVTSGKVFAFFLKCPVCQWGYLAGLKVEEGKNTKQPRAVLASKIYPLIFLRQILVSVNMASKVKAWLHSNKCSMCMPWVNDVNVIFISSDYNSAHFCLFLLLHV